MTSNEVLRKTAYVTNARVMIGYGDFGQMLGLKTMNIEARRDPKTRIYSWITTDYFYY